MEKISNKTKEQLLEENNQLRATIINLEKFKIETQEVENQLMKSELKSRLWLENSPVCTKIVDLDFNLQYMSTSGIIELKIDDITEYYGKPYPLDFYPDSFKIPMRSNLKKVKETGKITTQEAQVVDINGKDLWYHSTLVPVYTKGKLDYIMVVSLETTSNKRAEIELKESEKKYRTLFERESDAIFIQDPATTIILDANEATSKMYGYDRDELIGMSCLEFSAEVENSVSAMKQVQQDGEMNIPTRYHKKKDGTIFPVDINAYAITLREKNVIFAVSKDITERKKAEEDLKKSVERFERWKSSNFIGIIHSDSKGNIIDANDTILNMLGYSQKELTEGKLDWTKLTPKEFLHLDQNAMDEAAKTGTWTPFEKEYFHKDGHRIPILIGGSVFMEVPDEYIVFIIDLTKRKQIEKSLDEISKLNKMILDTAGEGIYGLDLNGNTTFVNPAAAKMIGWEVEEILGKGQHDLLHHTKADGTPYNRNECPIYAAYKDGKVHQVNNEVFWRKDGSSFPVNYISTPIWDDFGELQGAVVTFSDITVAKDVEEELKNYRDKLEELVVERTKKLEDKNKELDTALKVFVGREQKIGELEKKIRTLEGR